MNHVIVCGLGRVGGRVLEYLRAAGETVVVIDDKPREVLTEDRVTYLIGDFRDGAMLARAGLAEARGVLLVASDDLGNLSALMTILSTQPGLRVVVRMFNPQLVVRLGPVASNVFALSASALAAPMIALLARTGSGLAAFSLGPHLSMAVGNWTVPPGHELVGKPLAQVDAAFGLRVVRQATTGAELGDVEPARTLLTGDRLIVAGPTECVESLVGDGVENSRGRRGYGYVQFLRALGRVVMQVDWPVRVCAGIFAAVIVGSVFVFRFCMEPIPGRNPSFVEAFFRTIRLLATGADMDFADAPEASWQKGFIGTLRLVGTVLTAAFTAIFTNYLVRAQLRGALEVRKIPRSGHVVVAGLGNVGFRVAVELLEHGERVVAIEQRADNPFVPTARRLGAAVIIGDATVTQVLNEAHAATARSFVAATENELSNLEIGLLVRQLHPQKRVVLRLIDSKLAQLLRTAASIRLAVSIPDLAAPAFLAALYGDRVRTVFIAESHLFAVLDVVVQADDVMLGQPVDGAAKKYRFVPLAMTSGGHVEGAALGSRLLTAGDTLTAIVAFRDLSTLLQRETRRAAG
jgi:Trk K+ transport system NAD-binding subunit